MDNDDKMNQSGNPGLPDDTRHNEVLLFLNTELERIQKESSASTYNLAEEYARTKKHKSFFVPAMLLGCCCVVFGIVWGMNRIISGQNNEITVNLEDFDDLNLKVLLDSATKLQTNYENAVKNKSVIENNMEMAMKEAEGRRERELFLLESLNLINKREKNKRLNEIRNTFNAEMETINAEFGPKLAVVEKEIEEYQAHISQFDTAKLEAAREQEKILDSERQLQELERKKLTEQYESRIAELDGTISEMQKNHSSEMKHAVTEITDKYTAEIAALDPVLNDSQADSIIGAMDSLETPDYDSASVIVDNGIIDETAAGALSRYQVIYDDYRYMEKAVAAVPQQNSIPLYVKASRALVNSMGAAFADTTVTMQAEKDGLREQVSELELTIQTERADNEEKERLRRDEFEQCINGLLAAAKSSAALVSMNPDENSVGVFVAPRARYLVDDENGVSAEIKGTKTQKGRVVRSGDDGFVFITDPDKDGNLQPIDFEDLSLGMTVKLVER